MRVLVLVIWGVLCSAGAVRAGPWPREAGAVFLSFSGTATVDRDTLADPPRYDGALYGEIGLGHRFTLGLDLHADGTTGTGLVFLRRTLTRADARHQVALSFGGGLRHRDGTAELLWMAGGSWGMGFDTRWGAGWATVEGQVRGIDTGTGVKLDATLGLRPSEAWLGYLQLQHASAPDSDETLDLELSIVRRLNDRLSLQAGAVYGLRNSRKAGIRLGLWTEF